MVVVEASAGTGKSCGGEFGMVEDQSPVEFDRTRDPAMVPTEYPVCSAKSFGA